jgi:hypothetical protein
MDSIQAIESGVWGAELRRLTLHDGQTQGNNAEARCRLFLCGEAEGRAKWFQREQMNNVLG